MMIFHVLGQTEELVKALQDLENAASGDATVRQKIASLPQEVQDVSLLEKITGQAQEPPRERKQTGCCDRVLRSTRTSENRVENKIKTKQ